MSLRYLFFCSKYSDLDNMLPVAFALLDRDNIGKAELYWYGKQINYATCVLLRFAQNSLRERFKVWIPHRRDILPFEKHINCDDLSSKSSFCSFLKRISSKASYLSHLAGKTRNEDGIWDHSALIASHISTQSEKYNLKRDICFFGFSERTILEHIHNHLKSREPLWVRLPQGVRLTVSAFKTTGSVLKVNNPDKYLPAWADAALDVDRHMYENIAQIRETLGLEPAPVPDIPLLGSPRFSRHWISELDLAFSDIRTKFEDFPKHKSRMLFLLTPAHKNVWREELLRVLTIVDSYDVNLIVKGFHGNTKEIVSGHGFVVDEICPTSALIRDADAILFISTSAALEGYVRQKEMLQMSYLHGNQTSLEQAGVGIMAHSRDEVHLLMNRYVKTGSISPRNNNTAKTEAENFVLSKIVGNNPMLAYAEYIGKIAEKHFNICEERRRG